MKVNDEASKGMNPLFAVAFMVLIFVIAAGVVLNVGFPAVDQAAGVSKFDSAIGTMKLLDNAIREVAMEGKGAKRLIKFSSPGEFEVIPQEDAVQFKMRGPQIIEYLSRKLAGTIAQIGGSDVSCSDSGNLTLENTFLRFDIRRVPQVAPNSAIWTNESIMFIREKGSNTAVTPVNSSIIIDGDSTTLNGTGYSEILRKGNDLPSCTAHVFVNSTVLYDVYYTLYAGADFIVMDVRNVR